MNPDGWACRKCESDWIRETRGVLVQRSDLQMKFEFALCYYLCHYKCTELRRVHPESGVLFPPEQNPRLRLSERDLPGDRQRSS